MFETKSFSCVSMVLLLVFACFVLKAGRYGYVRSMFYSCSLPRNPGQKSGHEPSKNQEVMVNVFGGDGFVVYCLVLRSYMLCVFV